MYYDIGNHWKYGQPRAWLDAFGRLAVKLDIRGYRKSLAVIDFSAYKLIQFSNLFIFA